MKIFTYVLEGALTHQDSSGMHYVLKPNMIQVMSAGNGVIHSEFNASQTEHYGRIANVTSLRLCAPPISTCTGITSPGGMPSGTRTLI